MRRWSVPCVYLMPLRTLATLCRSNITLYHSLFGNYSESAQKCYNVVMASRPKRSPSCLHTETATIGWFKVGVGILVPLSFRLHAIFGKISPVIGWRPPLGLAKVVLCCTYFLCMFASGPHAGARHRDHAFLDLMEAYEVVKVGTDRVTTRKTLNWDV